MSDIECTPPEVAEAASEVVNNFNQVSLIFAAVAANEFCCVYAAKTVLIDLSGTLHVADEVIPGAVEALKRLRNTNLRIQFVTNTTKQSRKMRHDQLKKLGFDIAIKDIHSSLSSLRNLIIKRKLKPMLLVDPQAYGELHGLSVKRGEKPNAVCVGHAPTEFTFKRLNEAFGHLLNGASLIGMHAGKRYARKNGVDLGPGCFIKGLEYSADCKAELVGKPNKVFFRTALEGTPPENAIMIGDDVEDDVLGAMDIGMRGILVQTGKYKPGDESKIDPRPNEVVPSFVEAVEVILNEINNI